ncbi:hypothetical protein B0A55_07325 [Friedmanniomyces simplex]|uniref:Diphthine--ammonia ligase n=1 Tax=Friedmanniomyces simplex TaxID=329884 RepID=A0A4U0XC38_9PEZI|nr:hypothetical protein B0A55_07325 [Friedmanniomyces simplex]
MAGLKVVALISGGKDSLFSILHCIANGHEVVALANLHPPLAPDESAVEDTDSFMYQTIGHAVVPLFEAALGLPLYRQEIAGSAVNQYRQYGYLEGAQGVDLDETESLIPLLIKIKKEHPDINAVSTGAILSDYQRTRVESVALRLGFTPLSYLWQWPNLPPHTDSSLLEDMAAVGQDSRIVKVASGGLDESFLWQNVADPRTIARLSKAAGRFGSPGDGAVLGEGGEYETLAVGGPPPLWKAGIVVTDESRIVVPGEAGSSTLRLVSPVVIAQTTPCNSVGTLRIPPLLEESTKRTLENIAAKKDEKEPREAERQASDLPDAKALRRARVAHSGDGGVSYFYRTSPGQSAAAQMRAIMDSLATEFSEAGTGMANIIYASIILRDMADFAAINKIYGGYFMEPIPPARATLACRDVLPDDCSVMVGVTCLPNTHMHARKGLHVQSRSYWAPANIGPYSQAVSVPTMAGGTDDSPDLVYVAGQIPLNPASMELSCGESSDTRGQFAHQAVLALQHMVRIGRCTRVNGWIAAIAFVVKGPDETAFSLAQTAYAAWRALHAPAQNADAQTDEDEGFDVWDLTHRHGGYIARKPERSGMAAGYQLSTKAATPPLWVVEVDALPRNASIEWVGYGTTGNALDHAEVEHLRYLLRVFRDRIVMAIGGEWATNPER